MKDIDINMLLNREQVVLENKKIEKFIYNKVVLITGAGGSIGSELCRQIASFEPKELIMLDIYENTLYEVDIELRRSYPKLELKTLVASIRDEKRIEEIFKEYLPDLVFHAAAHKHVPLMEVSPIEAIKNNVFGTLNVAKMAGKYGTDKFILVSTDKAVNPTSIMGATKRICEILIQMLNTRNKTNYVAVRFGNVLGSHGSVIPIFKKQIEQGGPITLTHKDITRYFMTISEAVGLILQAITFAEGGEIFVLDMGEQVRIYDLAVKLIELYGYEAEKDIRIDITGLRPGEKLYEELIIKEEGLSKTSHKRIYASRIMDFDEKEVIEGLEELRMCIAQSKELTAQEIKQKIKTIVPTYVEK